MNVELTIKVCKIELENASDIHKKGQTDIAIEILRNIVTYLDNKLPPENHQPDEDPKPT